MTPILGIFSLADFLRGPATRGSHLQKCTRPLWERQCIRRKHDYRTSGGRESIIRRQALVRGLQAMTRHRRLLKRHTFVFEPLAARTRGARLPLVEIEFFASTAIECLVRNIVTADINIAAETHFRLRRRREQYRSERAGEQASTWTILSDPPFAG